VSVNVVAWREAKSPSGSRARFRGRETPKAKPRDKAKVEVAVQVAERWILARPRNETFFTLAALNARIAELLTDLNDRPMKGYGGASRRALFERFDRPALQALPRDRYVHADWSHARDSSHHRRESRRSSTCRCFPINEIPVMIGAKFQRKSEIRSNENKKRISKTLISKDIAVLQFPVVSHVGSGR